MFVVEGVLSFVAAAGLFVLATGRAQVKAWVPVLAAFTGTGALFAWGLFQAVVTIVPVARERPAFLMSGVRQPTVTVGAPAPSSSIGSPISSAIRIASSMRVSTIWLSGTVLMTSPLTKI